MSSLSQWAKVLAPIGLVASIALGLGALIRAWSPVGKSVWLLDPLLYLRHGQNLDKPEAIVLPLGAAAIVLGALILLRVRDRLPKASRILEVTGALLLGGALANLVEVAALGSVTDFFGIRGSGIYSSGDIAFDLGLAVVPVATFKITSPMHGKRLALIASAITYVAITGVQLTDPRGFPVAILATIVTLLGLLVGYASGARPRA